jgi:hypothetical protein
MLMEWKKSGKLAKKLGQRAAVYVMYLTAHINGGPYPSSEDARSATGRSGSWRVGSDCGAKWPLELSPHPYPLSTIHSPTVASRAAMG